MCVANKLLSDMVVSRHGQGNINTSLHLSNLVLFVAKIITLSMFKQFMNCYDGEGYQTKTFTSDLLLVQSKPDSFIQ